MLIAERMIKDDLTHDDQHGQFDILAAYSLECINDEAKNRVIFTFEDFSGIAVCLETDKYTVVRKVRQLIIKETPKKFNYSLSGESLENWTKIRELKKLYYSEKIKNRKALDDFNSNDKNKKHNQQVIMFFNLLNTGEEAILNIIQGLRKNLENVTELEISLLKNKIENYQIISSDYIRHLEEDFELIDKNMIDEEGINLDHFISLESIHNTFEDFVDTRTSMKTFNAEANRGTLALLRGYDMTIETDIYCAKQHPKYRTYECFLKIQNALKRYYALYENLK